MAEGEKTFTQEEVNNLVQKRISEVQAKADERNKNAAAVLSKVRYFYFIDKYGLQWEFEQGHTDIGN
mgnify:CR=1 FL=1